MSTSFITLMLAILSHFGATVNPTNQEYDFDGNGKIETNDLLIVLTEDEDII